MMSPKCALTALCILVACSFLSGNTFAMPLDEEENEIDLSYQNTDYSSINIDSVPEEANEDEESEEAKDNTDEDLVNDSEVEYVEEAESVTVEESEEKPDHEVKGSDEEETDKAEEDSKDEDSGESGDDDEEEMKKNEEDDDDKTMVEEEDRVLLNSGEGKDYVHIVQILDDDDTEKETKSASWYEKIKKYFATKFGLHIR